MLTSKENDGSSSGATNAVHHFLDIEEIVGQADVTTLC